VLEGPRQAAPEDPGVEGVVTVLDQHRSAGEVEEGPASIAELGRADQHLTLDQMPALGVGVDRSAGMDQGVEEAQRATQPESLRPDLEDQEGPVAGGLDVDSDIFGFGQWRVRTHRDEVDLGIRLPGDRLGRAPRFELQ
jgi:hypothetical protein